MLQHLLEPEFVDFDPRPVSREEALAAFVESVNAPVKQVLDAKIASADWLTSQDAQEQPALPEDLAAKMAREAFLASTDPSLPEGDARIRAMELRSPAAVHHMVSMLTAYDWEFVNRAKEIRSYVVGKLLVLSESGSESGRLRALRMLGDITEVGLFTTRIEVGNRNLSDEQINTEIDKRLQRLQRLMSTPREDVVDATEIGERALATLALTTDQQAHGGGYDGDDPP